MDIFIRKCWLGHAAFWVSVLRKTPTLLFCTADARALYNYRYMKTSKIGVFNLFSLIYLGDDQRRTRVANAYFSLCMAVGNILGFATGSYSGWYKILPFTVTSACNADCANLKSAFYLDVVFIVTTTCLSITAGDEMPAHSGTSHSHEHMPEQSSQAQEAFFWELFGIFKYLSGPVWIILLVTALTWIGWFPFLLYDTDWMGREIYGGEPNDGENYNIGVRMGALGLMLNSVFLGITSLLMEVLCRKLGAGVVWGISNILMSLCFLAMLVIAYIASHVDKLGDGLPPDGIVAAALVVFAILGIPLAVSHSVLLEMILGHLLVCSLAFQGKHVRKNCCHSCYLQCKHHSSLFMLRARYGGC